MPLSFKLPPRLRGRVGRGLELHLRRLFKLRARLAEVEELLAVEAEQAGDQHRREVLDAGVVFLHGVVEEAPRGGELVLYVAKLVLELLEVGVGFEVRIGLRERERWPP